ncbi:efflux RND transporter periplasmic adaptor subunit [Roseateles cavernae]|uniref:efflux RND transporter periplasmic adaptor subunit n=1 Tax=Roseateles cavernae TaxID=3153578 RepID=UPI0032E4CD1A
MSFKKLHSVVAVVALVGLSALAYWWQHQPGKAQAAAKSGPPAQPGGRGPLSVEAGRVQVQSLADDAQAVGALRARQSVMLRPEVSGRITKLGFTDGQRVRQGQLLVQLDEALQAAQLQQAEAQAGIARTQLQRNRELLAQSFVSPSVVDQAEATLKVAEAQVSLARAQLARLQVRAPFDGVMGIRLINLGDYVKDGADLVSVEDASSMWVDFRLPERFVPQLRLGQDVSLGLDALPGREFKARIEALDSQLDTAGRSMLVRARLLGDTSMLRSGLFARVRVVFALREQALVVPEEALVPMGGKQFVVKLVEGADGRLMTQRVEAQLGMRVPGKVELLGGVKAGDRVVTAGQGPLMRGESQAVKLVDLDKPAAARAPAPAASAASR